ncbi:MAG TPA: right-handed parallel beta-helix repeat-containing protein [Candidatus Angelobacter sp.]
MRLNGWAVVVTISSVLAQGQSVLRAEKYPGADAGEKIRKCMDALPSTGGVCDARNLSGNQSADSGFTVGTPGKPVELMLGPVTLLAKGTIHVLAKSSIVGMPASAGIGSDQSPTVIKAADGSRLNAIVQIDGPLAVLQDLTVDGNKKDAPQGNVGILVLNANRAEMFRVTAQNAPKYGMEIYSDNNESCCAKLSKIMAIANGETGLHLANTADVFISLSEFEENGKYGVELNNSPTTRLEHSDFGGNFEDGIRVYGTAQSRLQSNRQIIVGNQFGNNAHYDINIQGFDYAAKRHVATGHLISSNEFIGSDRRPSGYDAIHITDSGENNIFGNIFSAGSDHPYRYCIFIEGKYELPDQINGNYCRAVKAGGTGDYKGTGNTVFGTNSATK